MEWLQREEEAVEAESRMAGHSKPPSAHHPAAHEEEGVRIDVTVELPGLHHIG